MKGETQRLKEIINEQHACNKELEAALINIKNDCKTYKTMWQRRNTTMAVKQSIVGQLDSFVKLANNVLANQ